MLLDLGSGALGTLHRFVDPLSIDAFISHLHPDHYFDISGLYVMWKYHPRRRAPADPGVGPARGRRPCTGAYGLDPATGMSDRFDFHEYDDQPIRLAPFTIRPHPRRAPDPGLRAARRGRRAGGRLLRRHRPLPGAGRPRERTRPAGCASRRSSRASDNPVDLHLTGKQAGVVDGRGGGSPRLVLTHVPPWHDPSVPAGRGPGGLRRPARGRGHRVDVRPGLRGPKPLGTWCARAHDEDGRSPASPPHRWWR